MGKSIFAQAAQFLRDRRDNRRWQAAVFCLATLVVCGTTWALVRQAQAFSDSEGEVLNCKFEVHEHSADCYEDGRLACGKVEYVVHVHDEDSCYDEDGSLVCLLSEEEGHVHDADCFEIVQESLVCGFEEGEVDLYMEDASDEQEVSVISYTQEEELICGLEEHSHDEGCYEYEEVVVGTESVLSCGQEESEGHSHGDSCYEYEEIVSTESVLSCGQEESEEHSHDEGCYEYEEVVVGTESVLSCGQEESEGHSHGDSCYEYEEIVSTESVRTCGKDEHTHDDSCVVQVQNIESVEKSTQNTAADDAEGHTHSDDCYGMARKLVCGEEGVHIHDDDCYQDGTLICTAPEVEELEEHEHGPECFAAEEEEEYIKIFRNDDMVVTAAFSSSAEISEEAELLVEHIADKDDESYEARLAELEETDGALADDEEMAMLLGISFQTLDEKFVPKDTVNLTVQFLNDDIYTEGDEVTVACFGGDGVDLISGTDIDEEGSTTFDVDNLSEIAFIAEKSGISELVYEGEDYIVTVDLEEGSTVPEEAELLVEKTTQEDYESYVEYFERLDEAGLLEDNEIAAMLLDMKIYAEDEEIVPDGTMEVTVQFLNREIYFEEDAVKAAHITDDDIELLEASDIDDELSTTFTVEELAEVAFIIDGDIRTMTVEGDGYIITVRFGPKALIPEDAKLVAERITAESDPEYFTAREEQLQEEITDEFITLGALFNFGFYDADDEEIEPQSTVDIKIQLLDGGDVEKVDSIRVAHFVADEENEQESIVIIEDADVTKEGDGSLSTTFQTESLRSAESRSKEE